MLRSLFPWLRGGSGWKTAQRPIRTRSFVPRLLVLEDRTLPSNFIVNNLADSGAGSLRQAILDANSAGGNNNITFTVIGTVTLQNALPDLTTNVDFEGPGPGSLSVQRSLAPGTPDFSILTVDWSATVRVAGVMLTNGSGFYGGGIFNDSGTLTVDNCSVVANAAWRGGGILNFGSLTVTGSTLSGNVAANNGGGIANFGPLTIDHSSLSGNSGDNGGAVYNFGGGNVVLSYSTLSSNSANFGGAIANNGGTVTVDSSTVAQNTAAIGGGVGNPYGGTVIVRNSTFAGNTATYANGGGIANDNGAALAVSNSTFSGNAAASGGGIANSGTLTTFDTILAGNLAPAGADLSGALGSLGHNLIGNTTGGSGFDATDLLNVDPWLGSLQYNGGPTPTMALLPGSPAIDAGDNTGAPTFDQRGPGFARIVNGGIDIGAFEVQGFAPNVPNQAVPFAPESMLGTATLFRAPDAPAAAGIAGAAPAEPVVPESAPLESAGLDWLFAAADRHDGSAVRGTGLATRLLWPGQQAHGFDLESLPQEGEAQS
jgi:hypothetical protein